MSTDAPIRWAFVGASAMANEFMAPSLKQAGGCELVAIVSSSTERGAGFARRHGVAHRFLGVQELLERSEIFDAAYVSTANDTHHSLTAAVVAAGRHVLCEKPLTVTSAQADELVAQAARAGMVLAANHHLRGAAVHRQIRQLIDAGTIGLPRMAQVTHTFDVGDEELRWRRSPEHGGGVILDATTHDVDIIRYLLDCEIASVSALSVDLAVTEGRVEDGVTGWMVTDSGVRVSFTDAFQQSPVSSELVLHGTAGSLRVGGAMDQLGPRTIMIHHRNGDSEAIEIVDDNPYAVTLDAFHAAVRGDGSPLASGADGAQAIRVAEAIVRSVASNGAIVSSSQTLPSPSITVRDGQ